MFNEVHDQDIFSMAGAIEALSELEQNAGPVIIQQQAAERLDIHTKVTIRPGDDQRSGR